MLIRKFMYVAAVAIAGAMAVSCSNSSNQGNNEQQSED
jgi:hypothetical protein